MTEPALPYGLLAELSHRCPLQCPYCSNPVALQKKSEELPTDLWVRAFQEAARLGILQVHLSGGEPTVRPDLEELVQTCADLHLYTNLITSGVLLTPGRLKALATAGLDHVQLSLQGATAALANRIGGFAGGHQKKLQVARWITDANLPLTLNLVVHRQNLQEVDAVIDLALELGAGRLEIAHTQYLGWALTNRAALLPSREVVIDTNQLVARRKKDLLGRLAIDYVVPDYYGERPKACMGGWARQFLMITPAGDVLPCHGADSLPDLIFPNLRDHSLDHIWHQDPAFQRFRGTDWMPEPCQSCPRRDVDFGGCRCQAFALTGKAENPDPVCALSEHHHLIEEALNEASEPLPEMIPRTFS